MLVVIRLSPILPPSFSLSHSSQLLWARIYHGKQSIRGDGDEQADCTLLRRFQLSWQSISVLWISIDRDVSHIPRNRKLSLQVTLRISHRVNLIYRKKSEQRKVYWL